MIHGEETRRLRGKEIQYPSTYSSFVLFMKNLPSFRYHNIWRDKHDPYDPYHPYNKYKDEDNRPWRKFPGWDYEKPRADWYYTRPMIETDRGHIRGYNITVDKIRISQAVYPNEENYLYKMISIFLGIPYALPPVGDWRFKRPMNPDNWFPDGM